MSLQTHPLESSEQFTYEGFNLRVYGNEKSLAKRRLNVAYQPPTTEWNEELDSELSESQKIFKCQFQRVGEEDWEDGWVVLGADEDEKGFEDQFLRIKRRKWYWLWLW